MCHSVFPLLGGFVAAAGFVAGIAPTAALAADSDTAVRDAVDHYLKGHATGSPEEFRLAFHPESKLFWVKDGQLTQRTSADYISHASGKPADDESKRRRRIVSVDVTGDAAVAKVELDYPQALLTDYLTLLRVGGEWKIVNKVFFAQPRKPN